MGLTSATFSLPRREYHGHGNVPGGSLIPVAYYLDSNLILRDDGDTSKLGQFELADVSTATTRTVRWPNFNARMAGESAIDVRAYGATGDGATDDSQAVLSALQAASTGQIVWFPKGTYNLSSWTVRTLSTVVWIKGDGIGGTTIKGTASTSFLSITANTRISDLTFDTWNIPLDFSAVSSVLDSVLIENVEIKTYGKGIYGNGSTASTGFRNFTISGCRLTTGTNNAIFLNLPIMERVHVLNNVIKTCIGRGIDLGGNSLVFADDRGEYVIDGNIVEDVSQTGASAIAIICYGWRGVITNNLVRNVSRDDPTASDCDGIYTKCRYSVIDSNVLVDAGQAEAFINVKGGARNEGVTQPYGFSVIVSNNMLLDTQTTPTLAGASKETNGIKIATSEVAVVNNHLEGMTEVGIYTDSDVGSDAPCHNLLIAGNTIKDHRGKTAIAIFGLGRRIRVLNNLIDSVTSAYDTSNQNFGIQIAKSGGGDVDVCDNRVHTITDNGQTPVGIQIKPSAAMDYLRVMDNHVSGATYGIQFATTAPDIVFIRHNTFGTLTSDQIKYSVTPTNLISLPAELPVVSYEATNDAAIYNGTGANAQELRIYTERVDGTANYERLSLQSNATSAKIQTQFAGTLSGGAAASRPLELGVGNASQWRLSSTGHIQGMTDATYDVGGPSNRPRDVYVGRDLIANAVAGRVYLDYTNSATVGNVTINKVSGRCNVASGATTVTVTNNRVTAAAHVIAVASQADANNTVVTSVVPAAGSFVITVAPAPAANMAVDFVVLNAD